MIQGIGYDSGGKWVKNIDCKPTQEYQTWCCMLARCYSQKVCDRQPRYLDCTAHEDFHDFQKFCEWASCQAGYGKGWQLDKDFLSETKMYSPETCLFLPREINNFLIGRSANRPGMLKGVCARGKGYVAQCQLGNGRKFQSKVLSSVHEAWLQYKQVKEGYAKEIAAKWQSQIDPRAYEALMNYQVEITD